MNKPFDVLPHNLDQARREYSCCYSCIVRAEDALVEGDYDLVIKRAQDLIRSAEQLKRMQSEKHAVNRLIGEVKNPTVIFTILGGGDYT